MLALGSFGSFQKLFGNDNSANRILILKMTQFKKSSFPEKEKIIF